LITLDDYCDKHEIRAIDLIKIDIEGGELLVLKGAERLLTKVDAPVILLEIAQVLCEGFGYQAKDVWDFLMARGYTMYAILRNGSIIPAPPDISLYGNFVAKKGS